ncbi:MAG: DUF7901 domain-containing protein [Planctomycetota bacterium]
MNRLCTCMGGGSGVVALATLGLVSAMSLSSPASAQDCLQPPDNCQLPDQLGHGGGTVGATSDANPDAGFEVIDNFVIDAGGDVTSICWWGAYLDFGVPADCSATALPDLFTVTYYANVEGFPAEPDLTTIVGGPFVQGTDLVVTRAATGLVIPSGAGDLTEFEYTGTHAPVTIGAGECVWIAIQNDSTPSTCFWLWTTAPSATEGGIGDGNSYQDGAPVPGNDFDLAFCVNLPLGDPATCDKPINEGCLGANNDCRTEPSNQPGCADPECCTIVCESLPLCCISAWTQQCVDLAIEICVFVPPAPQPCLPLQDDNCQLPDLSGSGGLADDTFIGSASDRGINIIVADNFAAAESAEISQVCWWGFYSDSAAPIPDCGDTAVDDFTITYYADDGNGLPVSPPLASFTGVDLTVTRVAETVHPGSNDTPDDDLIVYRYQGFHAGVGVVAAECYWLEIANNLDGTCVWFWETADNGTGVGDFDYSLQDDTSGYEFTDAQDIEMGWCLDIVLGDVAQCAPPNPQEFCDPAGSVVLTQNTDPLTIVAGNSVACVAETPEGIQRYTAEAYFARSYNLAAIPETAGQDIEVVCVRVAVESNNGNAYPVLVSIYEDTNGGAPTSPDVDLNLIGFTEVYIPVNTILGFVEARFDPPVLVPADTVMVVDLFARDRNPAFTPCDVDGDCPGLICVGDPIPGDGNAEGFCDTVFDSGGMFPGTNDLGNTATSYIRSPTCAAGSNNYFAVGAVGFPQSQLVQEVHVDVVAACPCDCNNPPDGVVNVQDFLALLAQWGGAGSCDCKDPPDGVVDVQDFLQILATWGPCP